MHMCLWHAKLLVHPGTQEWELPSTRFVMDWLLSAVGGATGAADGVARVPKKLRDEVIFGGGLPWRRSGEWCVFCASSCVSCCEVGTDNFCSGLP